MRGLKTTEDRAGRRNHVQWSGLPLSEPARCSGAEGCESKYSGEHYHCSCRPIGGRKEHGVCAIASLLRTFSRNNYNWQPRPHGPRSFFRAAANGSCISGAGALRHEHPRQHRVRLACRHERRRHRWGERVAKA